MSRFRLTIGALAVMTALVLFGAASATSAPVVGTDVLYTLDADFDQGTLVNVNHDAPNNNQLQLNTPSGTFPFIWIALSQRCTIAKINTDDRRDPRRVPHDLRRRGLQPSRRGPPSARRQRLGRSPRPGRRDARRARASSTSASTATATGRSRPRRATATSSRGRALTRRVANAQDECILHHVNTDALGFRFDTRHMSIDADNKLWVGGFNGGSSFVARQRHHRRGRAAARTVPCGGYGGLIDANGVIWSANGSGAACCAGTRTRPTAPRNPRCIRHHRSTAWRSTRTARSGRPALRQQGPKVSPDGNTVLGPVPARSAASAQGLAVDSNGDVWVSSSLFCGAGCTIGHLKNDGTFVGNVPNPTGAGSTGVAVDAAGKIWTANLNSNTATRIDPTRGPLGCGGTGCGDGTQSARST